MADFFLGSQETTFGTRRKRRHSYSISRSVVAPSSNNNHSVTLTRRRSDEPASSGATASNEGRPRSRSILGFFKSRKFKRRGSLTIHRSQARSSDQTPPLTKSSLLPEQSYTRVVCTVLHPQIHYKTLPITLCTTAYEIIVKLVGKYAVAMEDQNPDTFYLTEVRESSQGSYSRVLENSDRVYDIQARWLEEMNCFFQLCRKQIYVPEYDHITDNPIQVMVLSPSQDSFYHSFPGGVLTLEDHHNTTTVRSNISELTFPPSDLPHTAASSGVRTQKIRQPLSPSELSDTSHTSVIEIVPCALDAVTHDMNEDNGSIRSAAASKRRDPVVTISIESPPSDSRSQETSPRHSTGKTLQDASSPLKRNLNQLMQQSISQGMPSIMNKVVSETQQRSPTTLRKSWSRQRDSELTTFEQTRTFKTAVVCTPTASEEMKFPEYVIAPASPPPTANDDQQHSPLHSNKDDAELSHGAEAEHLDSDGETTVTQEVVATRCENVAVGVTNKGMPYNHRKTSRTIPAVSFETSLTIHPKFHTTASLYPSFSRSAYYNTEMDLMDSLSVLLQDKFKHKQEKSQETNPKKANQIKRPHTFHVSRSAPHTEVTDRERAIHRAAMNVRQRTTLQVPILYHSSSMTSVSSEMESDLDALILQRRQKVGNTHSATKSKKPPQLKISRSLSPENQGSLLTPPTAVSSLTMLPQRRTNHLQLQSRSENNLHRASRTYKSVEVIGPREDGAQSESYYAASSNCRPITVVVRSKSSLSLNHHHHLRRDSKSKSSGNLSVASSDLSSTQDSASGRHKTRHRPTSAPHTEKDDRIAGLMTSLHQKADKKWWTQF